MGLVHRQCEMWQSKVEKAGQMKKTIKGRTKTEMLRPDFDWIWQNCIGKSAM